MIHQPVRTGASSSNARQLQIHAESIESSRMKLAELLATRTGQTVAEMEALMEYDHVCDPSRAMQLGLIDKILVAGDGNMHPNVSGKQPNGSTEAEAETEAAADKGKADEPSPEEEEAGRQAKGQL